MLYILDGGKSTGEEEKIITKVTQLAAGAEAQAGAKIKLLSKITASMGIAGSADASREGRSILSKVIESMSNFLSEDQIRERLGDPIYSRFDAVIHFTDLQPDAVQTLLEREIKRQYAKLDEGEQAIIDSRKIVSLLKQNAHRLSNARQIKKFVREAFSAAITDAVL